MMVLGVNLRASPKRPSIVVGLDCQSQIVLTERFSDDDELVGIAQEYMPRLIAVGTPLNLPAGLCCLETSCLCDFASPQMKGRTLELELSRMGISCFFTTKTSIVRDLIYRGIEINRRLINLGHEVIEVYPHATKVILFGDGANRKNVARNPHYLKERLAGLVTGLNHHVNGQDHSACNAVLNAYTALLHAQNKTDILGSSEEGMLVLPSLPRVN